MRRRTGTIGRKGPGDAVPTEHYFSERPTSSEERRRFKATLLGSEIVFHTGAGVFSRLRIDPGTRLLVESAPLPKQGSLLDLGAGYGPIGLAVAKARPDLDVHLVELNERAVELAKENARANGLRNVTVHQGDGFRALPGPAQFAAIFTNPPYRAGKAAVYAWVDESLQWLEPGGRLVCVGQTKQGVKSLAAHMAAVFGNAEEIAKGSGYRVVASTKRVEGS